MNILVVAAHPDDEVLGMGGTIKKLTKNKNRVKIVIMATGIAARRSTNYQNSTRYNITENDQKTIKKQIMTVKSHAKKAAKLLGVTDIEFLDFPDNEMDTISNLELTKSVEHIIQKFKPEIVYTHTPFDVNVDHVCCYNAVLTATRPKKKTIVKKLLSFEVPSSTEWNFTSVFTPNIFVDISKELSSKIKALECYKTELQEFPHPRSSKALESIGNRWGTVSGYLVAEAFSLIRSLED
ncbi:MAG: GlcNAc-PI de-N-acetylase [Chloroflexi bacterium]|nr:GlcNAc-PI de-N-acetylase [Chloroflexota bacterium]|tara:strand:- start:19527 stop:20240 length:714 start_codon:yes stop_codon:yes gene_type:complete